MDSMLQIHQAALSGDATAFHEFLLCYKETAKAVYGFVEGIDDPSFYRGMIEHALPPDWAVRLIRSGRKQIVLQVMNGFDWSRFSRKRVCFFVDRDLSSFMPGGSGGEDNLYVTDAYSMENDMCTVGTFERVFEEVLNVVNLEPVEMERICESFTSNMDRFQQWMVPVMAQIVLWKRSGKEPCLANIRPKDFVEFKDGTAALKPGFETDSARVQYAASAVGLNAHSADDLAICTTEFLTGDGATKYVRGKYVLWCFVTSAIELHASLPQLTSRYSKPPKVKVTLGLNNAVPLMGPRARAPSSLLHFISRNYLEYIRKKDSP